MNAELNWTGAMEFTATAGENRVLMDAKSPIGKGAAMTPKELVVVGLGGCTAMDVAALFKKHKQVPTSFRIAVDVETSTKGHPIVFEKATLKFIVDGAVDAKIFTDAVVASQTKFCGVSAMLSKAFPIHFELVLNGATIHTGQAQF
jgi:putative redox protein